MEYTVLLLLCNATEGRFIIWWKLVCVLYCQPTNTLGMSSSYMFCSLLPCFSSLLVTCLCSSLLLLSSPPPPRFLPLSTFPPFPLSSSPTPSPLPSSLLSFSSLLSSQNSSFLVEDLVENLKELLNEPKRRQLYLAIR